MTFSARLLLTASLLLAPLSPAFAEKPFAHQGVAADAKRYETFLKSNWQPKAGVKAADLRKAGAEALGPDPRAASRHYANAVAIDDKDFAAWIGLAKALLAIKPDPDKSSERYDFPVNASGSAYRAYERATTPGEKAAALAVLGEALQRRSYWRPAIDALKTSLDIADTQAVRESYDKLRAEHGFRMADYTIDNEATPPRLCVQFSENLAKGQDFAKFVTVGGKDPQSVTAEGQQLCVEGLKHGDRYEIQVKAGLPSDVGENLTKTADLGIYVPDRKPVARFSGKSYVLPSRGQQGIPVVSVNTSKIDVEIYRIGDRSLARAIKNGELQRQLYEYDVTEIRDKDGVKVYAGQLDVATKLNAEVTTAVPVTDATGPLKPGAYVMTAKPVEKVRGEEYGQLATQWFIVSDLGLTAFTGKDGVHAFVRSLAEATPVSGAELKLVARNNEVLGTAKTDARGYVQFEAGLTKGEGGSAPAVLVAEKGAGEYAFLDLTSSAFDLSDRGVKGREAPGPVDGFVFTERGVYRPGEAVDISALVRDASGKAASLPTTLIVSRPDGVEHTRIVMNDQGLGGRNTVLPLAKTAMTGTWRLWLHTDPKAGFIAERTFLVEDFVPERLDMTLKTEAKTLEPGVTVEIAASGKYLYGPPARNLTIEGEIVVKPSNRDVEGFPGYVFGQDTEFVSPVREAIEGAIKTGSDGTAAISINLPQIARTAKALEAQVIVKLIEDGGRAIERTLTMPVDLRSSRIGIKPLFKGGSLGEGETAAFDVVLLDGANKQVASDKLSWELTRLDSNWQWYRRDGQWQYEAVTVSRKIATGPLTALTDAAAKITNKTDYGRYRLDVVSTEPSGPAASLTFNAGWYTSGDAAESPELLDVALDKAAYKAGDTAKLRIASKHGGKALITVLGNGLKATQEVEIAKGGSDVAIDVKDDWGAGVYVTAMVYRAMDEQAKRMPARSVGIAWLGLDQSARELKVAINSVPKVKSGTTMTVPVKIAGLTPGEDARVIIAAVDLGILNLTRYETPAPQKWFNAQRKLDIEIRDFYGRLIDGMHAERGALRSGGDGGVTMQGSPTVETVVAMTSGILKVAADGTATTDFTMPDFNGTVRVFAVAWSGDKTGNGAADVIVRDAVALTASVPRFLTLGDEAALDFDVHNIEGPAAAYKLDVTETFGNAAALKSASLAGRTMNLKADERRHEKLVFKPKDVGPVTVAVRVSGPDGIDVKREMTFEVMPPAGDIKRTTISTISGGGGKLKLSPDLVADLITSRTKINLSVGPTARLDVPALLTQLDRYPYGCAEQTISRALPLLYANALSNNLGLKADAALKARVQGAVERVFEMQDNSGAFGVWGPANGDLWLTAYVTDFLTRAKEAGYTVRQQPFAQALDRLQNFISAAEDFDAGGEDRAYALYVLARNARAPIGELRYYADTRLDRFTGALSKAQLGAALAMMGDKERAERAFAAALAGFPQPADADTGYRSDYGSSLRDGAALLTLASEAGISKENAPKLVNVIAEAYQSRSYTSTQEQAWMLLAANAMGEQAKATTLTINGQPSTGAILRTLSPAELVNGELVIGNDGDAGVDAVVSIIGAALTPEPAISKGFTIERTAYQLSGEKVDLASLSGGAASVKQNDRFVIVVKVTSNEAGGRVMLVDRLPAGFEIENPRLVESGAVSNLRWTKSTAKPEHTEFRDDRFVAAFSFSNTSSDADAPAGEASEAAAEDGGSKPAAEATIAYIVRAVTPGKFVHPAATVEDMYRPERHARTAAGTLTVTSKN